MNILPINFFQTCQETKSTNRTHEKNQEAKFQILFVEKIQKKSGSKIWKSYSWKSCIFFGDVQPKMCGINFPKNKQSCYQLLSKTSKVVISCYRVNTSKNRVVIKNKQSCYQLLSVVIGGAFLKNSENINQKNVWERPTFSKFCLRDIPKHFWPNMFGGYLPKNAVPKRFCLQTLLRGTSQENPSQVSWETNTKTRIWEGVSHKIVAPNFRQISQKKITNIPWRYLPKNNFHIPPKGFYLTNISVRYFLKHVFYIFFPK